MIRAVFWDNDGVLVDTEELYYQATSEILLKAGVILTEESFRRISLREGKSLFDLAKTTGFPQAEIERLRSERDFRYKALLKTGVRIIDGAVETLFLLRRQVNPSGCNKFHTVAFRYDAHENRPSPFF